MKNYSTKHTSSPMVLVVPLAIAFVVILAAAMFGRIRTENRSRASYSGIEQCTTACSSTGRNARFVKDKAACTLDCPAVVAKTMTCDQFCEENVKSVSGSSTNPTTGAEREWSSIAICKRQCTAWVAAGVGSPTPVPTTPSPTKAAFNCASKCRGVGNQGITALCTATCQQFNRGAKTCPSGCNNNNQAYKNKCMELFCSSQ